MPFMSSGAKMKMMKTSAEIVINLSISQEAADEIRAQVTTTLKFGIY